MKISEKKMQIVIDNYFKLECDVNTSIRNAYEKGFRTGVKKGLAVRPKLEQSMWIPCSERSPDEIDKYLVTLDYKEHGTGITTLWFHGLLGWDFPVADVVTAWMPLPEPYKAESEEV